MGRNGSTVPAFNYWLPVIFSIVHIETVAALMKEAIKCIPDYTCNLSPRHTSARLRLTKWILCIYKGHREPYLASGMDFVCNKICLCWWYTVKRLRI